jgi:hypothetical protein
VDDAAADAEEAGEEADADAVEGAAGEWHVVAVELAVGVDPESALKKTTRRLIEVIWAGVSSG